MTTPADDQLWSAIADPFRRQVLDLVVSSGDVSARWLAGQVPFSRQAVAKHLVVLERAGLVSLAQAGPGGSLSSPGGPARPGHPGHG